MLQIFGATGENSRSVIVGDTKELGGLRSAINDALAGRIGELTFRAHDGTLRHVAVVLVDDMKESGPDRQHEKGARGIGEQVPRPSANSGGYSPIRSNASINETAGLRSEQRLLRIKEVLAICGVSRSSLYLAIKSNNFPPPIKLSTRSSAWVENEVREWIRSRINARPSR